MTEIWLLVLRPVSNSPSLSVGTLPLEREWVVGGVGLVSHGGGPPIAQRCAQIACGEVEQTRQRWRHSQIEQVHGVDGGKHTISQSAESKQTIHERLSAAHHVRRGPLQQLWIIVTFSKLLRINSVDLIVSV